MEYLLVLRWLLAFAVLSALGLPIAARLFPRFAGRGAGLALPVALATLTLPAYWVGQVTFGPVALGAGLLVLVAASALAALDLDALRAGRLERAVEVERGPVLEVAVVFALAFLFLVAVRAVDPAVHPGGGEKFLDFGLLKALARAESLPPEDFWFAGEPVAYYYGGHLVSTLLARLTFTPPRFAYNLALAGFYAALVAAVYDLAGAVAADRVGPAARQLAGALAAFFVGIASNLSTPATVVLSVLPAGLRRGLVEAVAERSQYTTARIADALGSFSYWSASRVIPGTINEFPLFAWLNGDLHAHMMGTPFLVLAAALSYACYRTPATESRRRLALALGVVPLLGGFQVVVDTWSFPSMFGLLWLGLVFAPAHPASLVPGGAGRRLRSAVAERGLPGEVGRLVAATLVTGVAGVLAVVVAAPFLFGAATATSREVAVLAVAERSSLGALFLVHGAFVAVFLAYLVTRYDDARAWPVLLGIAALAVVALGQGLAVLVLTGPLFALGWVALRMDRPAGFETVLIVAGAGLVTIVEIVYLREQAGPVRMNTVFKTYMQVWVLWSVAVGVSLVGLLRSVGVEARVPTRLASALRGQATPGGGRPSALGGAVARAAVVGLIVLLVLSTAVYGALALGEHAAAGREPTLDATAFVERDHPGEARAIDWLDAREGTPTITSAPGTVAYSGPGDGPSEGMYTWQANPASSLTGVPTVAGWRHEVGYRGDEAYFGRVRDVDVFYTGSAADRRAFLRAYGVEYVWVGPAERDRYGSVDLSELEALTVAHESGSVTIYRVDAGRL